MKIIFALFIGVLFVSCSSDDDTTSAPEFVNLFEFDNSTSAIGIGYFVSSESDANEEGIISVILTNTSANTINGENVNVVSFKIAATQLQNIDYSHSVLDYEIIRNASIIDEVLSGGEIILTTQENGFEAIDGLLTINSFQNSNIDLDFSFVREDNKIVTGDFSGFLNDLSDQ